MSISDEASAYLDALKAQASQAQAALNHYLAFLAQRYQLREGDRIEPDGIITRKGGDNGRTD